MAESGRIVYSLYKFLPGLEIGTVANTIAALNGLSKLITLSDLPLLFSMVNRTKF